MPVGDIECPPSASIPRDCSHECRVCRVTVMGLSTYAKHISSQLHKDNVDALDKEEEKEDEEEYFDKELIQLINQRREQSQQEDNYNVSKEQQSDRYARRDEHHSYQCIDQQEWHQDHHERNWQWQNECFNNPRQNFMHPPLNHHSNRHIGGPRGRAGWHMGTQSKRQLVHVNVGSWHSNAGGATSWHQRGTGRNFHWHPEGKEHIPNPHSRNYGGNWQHNAYGNNKWNFCNQTDTFQQGRKWLQMHCDAAQDQDSGWSKKNTSNAFCQERSRWKKQENNSDTAQKKSDKRSSKMTHDFTSDDHIENNFMDFKIVDGSDLSHKTKPALCPEKNNILTKDKQHRWSPYPSQKFCDQSVSIVVDKNMVPHSEETKSDKCESLDKLKMKDDNNVLEICTELSEGRKTDHNEFRNSRMPSLKSPLRNIPDLKSLALKRDKKNNLKYMKFLCPAFGESRLSALNLETVGSNSYISKLRSAPKNTKTVQEAQEYNNEDLEETITKVLDKAREMLRKSQAIQSPDIQSLSGTSNDLKTGPNKAANQSSPPYGFSDEVLEDVSDDDLYNNTSKVDNTVESASSSDGNWSVKAENSTKFPEQDATDSNTTPILSNLTKKCFISKSISLDGGNDDNSHQSQLNDCENFENISDPEFQKSVTHSANSVLPDLSKLGLPVSLQRDLTRHIASRSKPGAHLLEPNLNNARRIRNISGHRKSDGDKDSGLKPTLRQILNASRRNINWEQVILHVTKKKQELGKGLPRFGIEMVAQVQSEQEGLDFDEESGLGIENYHWEGITENPMASTRKRSLSESSVAVEKASVYDLFNNHNSDTGGESSIATCQLTPSECGQKVALTMTSPTKHAEPDHSPIQPPTTTTTESSTVSNENSQETPQSQKENEETCVPSDSVCTFQNACENVVTTSNTNMDVGTDSCGSGTEQIDAQGVGKKRRAAGDGSCTETLNLERNHKRRKIRARKERSQVDQLLSISLKEEELNHSLQGVDNNLNQARAALQAAYLEVQRLLVLKQQITMEMSTLRTQRIQILQGLQGTFESTSDAGKGRPDIPLAPQMSAANSRNAFPFAVETPPCLSTRTPSDHLLPSPIPICMPTAVPLFPAAPAVPDSSIVIKQEPVSPEPTGVPVSTPALPSLQAFSPPETNGKGINDTSVYPVITASMSLSKFASKFPVLNTEPSVDRQAVSTATSPQPCFSPKKESLSVPSSVQGQSHFPSTSPEETTCVTALSENLQSTLVTIETKVAKKKKKLRKKKTLRAAHVPENSDTEQEVSKPTRKNRNRRASKESTVSTSTSQEPDTMSQDTEMNKNDNDSDSSIEVMEVPNPRFEVVEIRSEDEKPDSPSKINVTELGLTNQGCSETNDEVTSTSELGTHYNDENLSMDCRTSPAGTKNCSEVSSDPGEEEEPTEGMFEGHQASVNAMQVYCGILYTCSADKSVRAYNLVTRKCKAVFEGHTSKVNCLLVTHARGKNIVLFTGSSDHTIRCFNVKTQECFDALDLGERVLCLHTRWKILYAGLANGTVVTFNTKCNKLIDTFECHGPRAVSCLATAQEGARRLLLVGSYDCTISVRDARNGLLLRTLEGHTKTVLCMKVVNDLVFSGSSDQSVHAHNIHTGELVRIYKGHNHAVTVVTILGQVMVTACLDKFVRVYELQSHDRLQVYGGHSDMIMCMAIYKSMIYTGCYDGRVQAVRLNLMQNYRCWWHGCSLIFGVVEHLKQHLLNDHTNPNFQTLKCRWKNCDGFFTARRGCKQEAIRHLERHAEDSQGNA